MTAETGSTSAAKAFDRKFLIAAIPAGLFFLACFYTRFTTDPDPLWSEFGTPIFFGLVGLRAALRPVPPESRKSSRFVGILLIVLSAILALLAILDFQGAI